MTRKGIAETKARPAQPRTANDAFFAVASTPQTDGPPRGACSQDMVHDPKRGWVAKAAATEAIK